MSQSTLKSFFPTRKRAAVGDLKNVSRSPKTLLLDESVCAAEQLKGNSHQRLKFLHKPSFFKPTEEKKLVDDQLVKGEASSPVISSEVQEEVIQPIVDCQIQPPTELTENKDEQIVPECRTEPDAEPSDPTKDFDEQPESNEIQPKEEQVIERPCTPENLPVVFQRPSTPENSPAVDQSIFQRPSTPENSPTVEQAVFENLALNDLKVRVNKSKRIHALKDSLQRYHSRDARLKEIASRLQAIQAQDSRPAVEEFSTIEFEVPVSPLKSPLTPQRLFSSPIKSPRKVSTISSRKLDFGSPAKSNVYVSPRKLLEEAPSPVKVVPCHLKFEALVNGDALILPFKYRSLFEIFCAVDTVSSMFNNRNEKITFFKLKSGVQEMLRRNFSENHLAQIKTVLPKAFEFSQEKYQVFGKRSDAEYHLIIKPTFNSEKSGESSGHPLMTPSVLATRKREFNKSLLEITKCHHRDFLLSLDPPLDIPTEKVTRWHAEFEVNSVPDISPAELPQSPIQNKQPSARDVLDNARSLLSANARVTAAIDSITKKLEGETGSGIQAKPPPSTSASSGCSSSGSGSANDAIAAVSKALKGVPQSLVDKIKAKQAARAVEAMTRSPAQNKQAVMLSRLPEIARILRNLFVVERRSVLPLDQVTTKLQHSCRENLTQGEVKAHLSLIQHHVPEWLTLCLVRNLDYVKCSRSANVEAVMLKLRQLVENEGKIYHCR